MAATDETTMTMTTGDGETTGPVPLSALADAAARQLTLFEGQRYPDAEIKLSGGVKGLTIELDDFVSKRHAVKLDEDGNPERTLTVTLKADNVRAA